MVCPGIDFTDRATSEDIGKLTIQSLERHVPSAVPGIMFLSGGMSEEEVSSPDAFSTLAQQILL